MAFQMPTANTAPTPFTGTLSRNEVFASIYNMIISQHVFSDLIKGTYGNLAYLFRVDGSEYGDSKLFYSLKLGKVVDWTGDEEAANLLALNRPADPACQVVKLDTFKMVWLTVDSFLSKRAWGTPGLFSQFNSVVLATMRDTKRVFEAKTMNTFVGTCETNVGKQTKTITLAAGGTEDANRLRAQTITKELADLMIDMKDVNTSYNDYGYERSYDENELVYIWNADYVNEITKLDLPTIFHTEELKKNFSKYVLPAHYFGTVNGVSVTTSGASNTTIRALDERDIGGVHVRPGDLLPNNTSLVSGGKVVIPSYTVNPKVICKITTKDAIQYMSGFQTETEFVNPRSKTENHYLIFGYSSLPQSRLKERPYITVKEA